MLTNISTLGTRLNKSDQKSINGGSRCFPLMPCDIDESWDFGLCQCVKSNS
ncbi:hypothetical protein [Tenacibaculum aiptasiae]|uniref:hypothetical protein n=1 Tax=Tenacibaculum aiptasiae TaxID=426481 RepID=UPI001588013E|nr:hypothetical protein [Tenacibaculum aiptasiae]